MKRFFSLLFCLVLCCATMSAGAGEALPSLAQYRAEQDMLLELRGPGGEMEAYHEMERHIAGGNVSYTVDELLSFYCEYLRWVVRAEADDAMRPAIAHFIELSEALFFAKNIANFTLTETEEMSKLPECYAKLMTYSTQCDDLFVNALERLADYVDTYAETVTPEADPLYEDNREFLSMMGVRARLFALLFSGEAQGLAQARALLEACAEEGEVGLLLQMQYLPLVVLLEGDALGAAAMQTELLAWFASVDLEEPLYPFYADNLDTLYLFEARGMIAPEDGHAYVKALPMRYAFEVVVVSEVGEDIGFQLEDRLLALDGVEAYGPQQLVMLLAKPVPTAEITVRRGGAEVALTAAQQYGRYGIGYSEVLEQQSP